MSKVLKSLNLFKLIISLILIILSIYYIYQGLKFLKIKELNSHKIIKEEIGLQESKNEIIKFKNQKKIINEIDKLKIFNQKEKEELDEDSEVILIKVKKNDTFSKIINSFVKNKNFKIEIINKIKSEINLKNLKIGQQIFFHINEKKELKKIIIPLNFADNLVLEIYQGSIFLKKEKNKIIKEIQSAKFVINSSLYEDGIKNGLPINILTNAIRLYSFDIDFQRDIQKNTEFEISYEILINKETNERNYGEIHFINMIIQNKNLEYFMFKTEEGFVDYFNREGKNVKKSLLKTPIDGARLSSKFGMRKHPILGYNKLHKGVDFAAEKGTPVFAGGNGIIEYIGYNGGYGKYIRIRHNNDYKTAYAHLSSFNKNFSKGKRVNQGEVIAYVGSTGKSTGPHLHYEIIFQNKQINPMKMKLPSGKILKNDELKRYQKNLKEIYAKHLFALYE